MVESLENGRQEIAALIKGQFESLSWRTDQPPDLDKLVSGFHKQAILSGAKRPVELQTAAIFANRMAELRNSGGMDSFLETLKGLHIFIAGNVAMAAAGCVMQENEAQVTEDVSVFLLVKDHKHWRILAQAWDVVPDIELAFEANKVPIGAGT